MMNAPRQTDKLCAGFCRLGTENTRLLLAVAKAMLYAQSAADKKPSSGKEPPREKSA